MKPPKKQPPKRKSTIQVLLVFLFIIFFSTQIIYLNNNPGFKTPEPTSSSADEIVPELLRTWDVLACSDSVSRVDKLHDDLLAIIKGDSAAQGHKFRLLVELNRLYENNLIKCGHDHALSKRLRSIQESVGEILIPWFHSSKTPSSKSPAERVGSMKGRGFAMPVSDEFIHQALAAILTIRWLGSRLPVEVFYMGDEDLSPSYRTLLESVPHVSTRNIFDLLDDSTLKLQGWAIKPFALLLSSFEEAVLLDADVTFFRNPDELFTEEAYERTGTLYFLDRRIGHPSAKSQKWILSLLPPRNTSLTHWSRETVMNRIIRGTSAHHQESGVVAINKARNLDGLLATCMLLDGKHREETYKRIHGDKEAFWIGSALAGTPYGFNGQPAGIMGVATRRGDTLCSPLLLHFTSRGEPFWSNHGMYHERTNPASSLLVCTASWAQEPLFHEHPKPAKWHQYSSGYSCLAGPFNQSATLSQAEAQKLVHISRIYDTQRLRVINQQIKSTLGGRVGKGGAAAISSEEIAETDEEGEPIQQEKLSVWRRLTAWFEVHVSFALCVWLGKCVEFRTELDKLGTCAAAAGGLTLSRKQLLRL